MMRPVKALLALAGVLTTGCGPHRDGATHAIAATAQTAPWGTAAPYALIATSPDGRWGVVCQARHDTDGDGKVDVVYGLHGDLNGDAMAAVIVDATGRETPIDSVLATDPTGRYLAVELARAPVLIDTTTWTQTPLSGALPGFRLTGGYRGWSFDPTGQRLLFFRDRAPMVRELATGAELLVAADAWRASWSSDGAWVVLQRVVADTDGDGFIHGPNRTPPDGISGMECGDHFEWGASSDELMPPNPTEADYQRALDSMSRTDAIERSLWRVRDRRAIAGKLPVDGDLVVAISGAKLAIVGVDGGAAVELGSSECNPIAAEPSTRSVMYVCPTADGHGAVHWYRDGAHRDVITTADVTPLVDGAGTGYVGIYPGQVITDMRTGDDIARGELISYGWSDADRVVVVDRDTRGELIYRDGKRVDLARDDYGPILVAGDYLVFGATRVHLPTGTTHRVPLAPIAVRDDGAVLVDSGASPSDDGLMRPRLGPLYWVDPAK